MNAMLDETWTAAPETQAMPARLRGVTRRYGKVVVFDNVDFEVRHGELLALLGPNGAGKTTAISLLLAWCNRAPATRSCSVVRHETWPCDAAPARCCRARNSADTCALRK